MQTIKIIIRILLYVSIVFIVYYLYKFDYLIFREISVNVFFATASVLILWLGFFVSTLSWRKALKVHGVQISVPQAVYSHGISVFAKYIPGKIWVILGRASIVSENGFSLSFTSTISLKEQLVYLLLGLLISLLVLPFVPVHILFTIMVLFTAIGLYLFLFVKSIHLYILSTLFKLVRKKFEVPFITVKDAVPFAKWILVYWSIWSIAFYLLTKSVIPETSVFAAFAFPVSVCYGLLAVIVPGGVGVREGILILVLSSLGIAPAQAVTLSIIQRLWFITGEIFIFVLALVFKGEAGKNIELV
ncbi:MAG: lysylphosphatidylglycerol synthase domain-containing protein [Salinivirgaceae bacterium]